MGKGRISRYGERLFAIAKILYTETDKENPIKVKELMECLETMGIGITRSSVYRYIDAINSNLFPVKNIPWHGYYRAGDIK